MLRPEVQTLTLLYTVFDRKGTPLKDELAVTCNLNGSFLYPFLYILQLVKSLPFYIPPALERYSFSGGAYR